MNEHNPGPWRVTVSTDDWRAVSDTNGTSCYTSVVDAHSEVVALVVSRSDDPRGDPPPIEHNAKLIAAAPEMLEALRKAVVMLAGVCVHAPELAAYETYETVSSAIERATASLAAPAA